VRDLEPVREAECRSRGDDQRAQRVHGEDDRAPRQSVDERASEQDGDQLRRGEGRKSGPQLDRRAVQGQDLEGKRDGVQLVAGHRHRLADEEKAEVAVAERREDREAHLPRES
jgi:hypothetical protein